jgi:hypothetical protein
MPFDQKKANLLKEAGFGNRLISELQTMTTSEYEEYLFRLNNDDYDALIQDRIGRLNIEQQSIAQTRELKRKEYSRLITKLAEPSATEDDHERVYNALLNMGRDTCEHGRSYWKHCLACGEIDHLMFPELYDEEGLHYQDDK